MKDESTNQYKCDVIIGVPKGYELTATTQPYMHSTYAIVLPSGGKLAAVQSPDDLLKLAPEQLQALKVGVFAGRPASTGCCATRCSIKVCSTRARVATCTRIRR